MSNCANCGRVFMSYDKCCSKTCEAQFQLNNGPTELYIGNKSYGSNDAEFIKKYKWMCDPLSIQKVQGHSIRPAWESKCAELLKLPYVPHPYVPQPLVSQIKRIGYDFDGVIHSDVHFDARGQGYPYDLNSFNNKCFDAIIQKIVENRKKNYGKAKPDASTTTSSG